MTNFQRIPKITDPQDRHLWETAEKRAGFKRHFLSYITVNSFLWILWLLTGARTYDSGIPWPIWPTLGWGIGIVSHYLGAYVYPNSNSVEREYEKLKNEQSKSL